MSNLQDNCEPNRSIKAEFNKLFINNEFVKSVSGKEFPTYNPSNGDIIAHVAEGDKADVDKAVAAAKAAFHKDSEWRKMSPIERSDLMLQLANKMLTEKVQLASLETLNSGKLYSDCLMDIDYSVRVFKYYAGWTDKCLGDTIPYDDNIAITRKEPIGVVGQIIPWNYPLLMLAWKWGPALAAGCTIVMKPAEQTPLTALYMGKLVKECGFPPGVINIVTGFGRTAGAAISEHPDIQKVAFTGSVNVGRTIMKAAADTNLKRVTLELGGKSPLVIFPDTDINNAVSIAHEAIFGNCGQSCCAGSRTYVHEDIYDKFVHLATKMAEERKLGDPFTKTIHQGPQISEDMMLKTLHYIESGKESGAKLQTGGKRYGSTGYYVEPTVFSDVTDNMKIAQEEIFGPVQCILKFKTLEEVIKRANCSNYGLASGILTNDINKAMYFAKHIKSGSVWINCYDAVLETTPFGGYKMSGIGRELGKDGLDAYLETKTITMKINEEQFK